MSIINKTILIFLISISAFSKLVVISDIDDTIRQSNTLSKLGSIIGLVKGKSFDHMRSIFLDIEEQDANFHYVSASYKFLYNAKEWIYERGFPIGTYHQRVSSSSLSSYKYKVGIISKIISHYDLDDTEFLFFGDNSSEDEDVYKDIIAEHDLNASIYIRDVRTNSMELTELLEIYPKDGIQYYISAIDFYETDLESYFSANTIKLINRDYEKKSIVSNYIKRRLEYRLEIALCSTSDNCEDQVEEEAKKAWDNYYLKFDL